MTRYMALLVMMGCGVSQPASSQDDNGSSHWKTLINCGSQCDDLHPQGPYLVGETFDAPPYTKSGDTYYFSISIATKPLTFGRIPLTVVNTAALAAPGHPPGDRWFGGMIVSNGSVNLQLSPPSGTTDITHFTLRAQGTSGAYDTSVCDDAVPVAGRYQTDGTFVPGGGFITFACSDADAYKCIDWKYPPNTLPDAHQACTRMARDDIAGNGRAHTHLDTIIAFHDTYGVDPAPSQTQLQNRPSTWPPDPNNIFFEAAWGTQGAVCLARSRWRSLKPNALPELPHTNPLACDDDTVDSLIAKGAIFFESSHVNDAPLLRWHSDDDDYVVTVRGYSSALDGQTVQPFDDGHTYTLVSVDGYILRAIPESITDPDTELKLTTLYRNRATNHMVLALANDPRIDLTLYEANTDPEGWVFAADQGNTVPLGLFKNAATGDLLSTTATNDVPPGYTLLGVLGFVFPVDVP